MKKLLLFLSAALGFLGNELQAGLDWRQMCFTDVNICVHHQAPGDGALQYIMIRKADLDVLPELKEEMRKIGVFVTPVNDALFDKYARQYPLEMSTLESAKSFYSSMSPETKAALRQGGICGFGIASCLGSTYAALHTAGGALIVAKISCMKAGFDCGWAYVYYQDWKEWQKKQHEKAKTAAGGRPSAGGESSGPSSGGTSVTPVGPGTYEPVKAPGGKVTISESYPN